MNSRSKALDILRAIAIVLVLGRHLNVPLGFGTLPHMFSSLIHKILVAWQRGGWIGVDLFFVISGFLISGLLFNEHKRFDHISFKRFFIRRGLKIYPPFYFFIAITVAIPVFYKNPISYKSLGSELLFLQDYICGIFAHTWSLAVEEQFYLFLPLVLICLSRVKKSDYTPFRLIPVIFIFVSLTCLLLRILTSSMPYSHLSNLYPFHLRIDSLFFGVTISYFYHYHSVIFMEIVRRYKYVFLILGIILLLPAFIFKLEQTVFIYTIGLTLFYIGSGLVLMAIIEKSFNNNLFFKALSVVGLYSYSIYLWHIPMKMWGVDLVKRFLAPHWNWGIYFIIYFFGSIFLGIIMAKIIELPILKLRDKLFPSRSKSL